MKCTNIKNGRECGADLTPNQKFCGACGSKVTIDENRLKKCPSCNEWLRKDVKFCTFCGVQFDEIVYCQGKKQDGSRCNAVVSSKFCSECGVEQDTSFDVLDCGQGDGPKAFQGNLEETEIQEQKEIPIESKPVQVKSSARGLAVICVHGKFLRKQNLKDRQNSHEDAELMKETWKNYGCDTTLVYYDERTKFYDKQLIIEIENKLKAMDNLELFVFVLSTHGHEAETVGIGPFGGKEKQTQHFFFTKDGQFNTQDLMDRLAAMSELDEILKLFVIQACRSQAGPRSQNEDEGFEVILKTSLAVNRIEDGYNASDNINSEEISDITLRFEDGVDVSDAKGYMPPKTEDDHKSFPSTPRVDIKSTTEIIFHDEQSQNIKKTIKAERKIEDVPVTDSFVDKESTEVKVALGSLEGASSDAAMEVVVEMPPIQAVPHCDDSIVLFASMSGKFAYSKMYSQQNTGGWLIKALNDVLCRYKPQDKIHILDVLTEVNREVGNKQLEIKQNIYGLEKLEEEKEIDMHIFLLQHITSLKEITDKNMRKRKIQDYSKEVDQIAKRLRENIQADDHDGLKQYQNELKTLTEKIVIESDLVVLKAQSCFFHSVALDEDKLYFKKEKTLNPDMT